MVWKLLFRDRNPVKHLVSDAQSWSKPRISPRGRSRFSCLNHRFLQMFFFRGQTQKSLLRFTTLNVIIESKVTSLNLYVQLIISMVQFGNCKYTWLSGLCKAMWSGLKYLINNWMWLPWILDFWLLRPQDILSSVSPRCSTPEFLLPFAQRKLYKHKNLHGSKTHNRKTHDSKFEVSCQQFYRYLCKQGWAALSVPGLWCIQGPPPHLLTSSLAAPSSQNLSSTLVIITWDSQ